VHLELLAPTENRVKFSRKSRVEFRWTVQTQTSPGKRVSPSSSPGKSTESESAISCPPHAFRFACETLREVKKTMDQSTTDFSKFMAVVAKVLY
jgi:hypothetical protein